MANQDGLCGEYQGEYVVACPRVAYGERSCQNIGVGSTFLLPSRGSLMENPQMEIFALLDFPRSVAQS